MKLLKFIYTTLAIGALTIVVSSCSKDFLEPTVALSKDLATNVNTVDDLDGLALGAYNLMSQSGFYGRDVVVHATARSDDGFSNGNSGRFVTSANFNYQATDGDPLAIWRDGYEVIANANVIIGAEIPDTGDGAIDHIKGEAYAIRAISHMEILKYYGQMYTGGTLGIPYVKEYLGDLEPARNTIAEVWTEIEADLNMARSLMSESRNAGPVRFTTYGVAAIQSRYYLYAQNWTAAISAANYVIGSGEYSLASDAASVASQFAGSGGNTSMLELAFNTADNPGINGINYIINSANYGDVVATADLYNLFEATDYRAALYDEDVYADGWRRCVGKYPSPSWDDNVRVSRYAEVVLNLAEAQVRDGQAGPAATTLNLITAANNATAYGATVTIDDVLLEKRKELAFEGFRFHDLMRNGLPITYQPEHTFTGTAGTPGSDMTIGDSRLAFPVPESELNANSNMVQNDGY